MGIFVEFLLNGLSVIVLSYLLVNMLSRLKLQAWAKYELLKNVA